MHAVQESSPDKPAQGFHCMRRDPAQSPVRCSSSPGYPCSCSRQTEEGSGQPQVLAFQGSFAGGIRHSPAARSSGGHVVPYSVEWAAINDTAFAVQRLASPTDPPVSAVVLDPLGAGAQVWNLAALSALQHAAHKAPTASVIVDSSNSTIGACGALFPHDLYAASAGGAGALSPAQLQHADEAAMEQARATKSAAGLIDRVPVMHAEAYSHPDALILSRGLGIGPHAAAALLLGPKLSNLAKQLPHVFSARKELARRATVESVCAQGAALVHGAAAIQPAAVRYTGADAELEALVSQDLQEEALANGMREAISAFHHAGRSARVLSAAAHGLAAAHRDVIRSVVEPPPHPAATRRTPPSLHFRLALHGPAQRWRQAFSSHGLVVQSCDGAVGDEEAGLSNQLEWGSARPWHPSFCLAIEPPLTVREDDVRAGVALLQRVLSAPELIG